MRTKIANRFPPPALVLLKQEGGFIIPINPQPWLLDEGYTLKADFTSLPGNLMLWEPIKTGET